MSYGVGRRCGLDPVLLWLWCRLVVTALIRPLAWGPPCATGVVLKKKKKDKKTPCLLKLLLKSKIKKQPNQTKPDTNMISTVSGGWWAPEYGRCSSYDDELGC